MAESYSTQSFAKRVIGRQGEFETRRSLYNDQTDVICEYLRPDLIKGKVGQKDEGGFSSSKIVESSGPHAVLVWQRGFLGNMLDRKSPWFRDKLREPPRDTGIVFKGNDEVNTYLQDVDDHLIEVYRRSTFYDVMPQYVLDGGTVASPVMLRERDLLNDRIVCKVPDYSQRWLDKDIFGRDNVLHVKWEWDALQAVQFFGKDQLPLVVTQQLENGNHYTKTEYLQVIYPAGDPIFDDLPEGEEIEVTHPWMEFFISLDSKDTSQQKTLKPLNKGPGYFTRPFSTWHYHRNWNEVYGRSMGWWAIFDIKGSNSHWEALFGEAELSVRPPTWAMGTLRGLLDLAPMGQNWATSSDDYLNPPMFLDRKTQYNVAIDFADRLISAIKRHFHNDLFMGASDVVLDQKQPESVYAHWLMQSERNVQLLPQVETYENQVLKDNHDAFIESERMAEPAYPWGRLPEPPDIVKEFSSGENDVEFIGRLSMAQERDITISRYLQNIGISEILFNYRPELIEKIRWSQAYEKILEAGNFPQVDIVPEDEYQQVVQDIKQRAEQERLAEVGLKQAQAAKDLQGKTEKGSPLALLEGAVA